MKRPRVPDTLWGVFAGEGLGGGDAGGVAFLGLVIVGEVGDEAAKQAPVLAEGEDGKTGYIVTR